MSNTLGAAALEHGDCPCHPLLSEEKLEGGNPAAHPGPWQCESREGHQQEDSLVSVEPAHQPDGCARGPPACPAGLTGSLVEPVLVHGPGMAHWGMLLAGMLSVRGDSEYVRTLCASHPPLL